MIEKVLRYIYNFIYKPCHATMDTAAGRIEVAASWRFTLFTVLCFTLSTCGTNSEINVNISIQAEVAGDGEFGYKIAISESGIIASKNESIFLDNAFRLGKIIEQEERELSKNQRSRLSGLIKNLGDLDQYRRADGNYISDDWTYCIAIGNEASIVIYKFYLSLKEFEELKRLMDYVFEICPIEIELRRFA